MTLTGVVALLPSQDRQEESCQLQDVGLLRTGHYGAVQGEDDQSFARLTGAAGPQEVFCSYITVPLHRPTDGSGTPTLRMGQTRGPAPLGCHKHCLVCVFHRALQEQQGNHEGKIMSLHT